MLGWIAAVLLGCCAGCAWAALHTSRRARVAWNAHAARLEAELRYQGAAFTGQQLAWVQTCTCALLLVVAGALGKVLPAVAAAVAGVAPTFVLKRLRLQRTERIEVQLDGFLLALAHALKATPALGDGLRSCADVIDAPLVQELRVLLREHDLGTPLDRGFENMAARVQSPVVSAALSALRIGRAAGGDFVHTLERSAETLREMARLEGVVRTKTAEGRAQTLVVGVLPLPTLYLINRLSPAMMEPLWTSDAGHTLLAIALVMWAVAFVAARRIAQVDI